MKKIITLLTVFMIIGAASYNMQAVAQGGGGSSAPVVSPNPAHDYIKVNWSQSQCYNVNIGLYFVNGSLAKTLTNHSYCEGNYSEMFKLGVPRGAYYVKINIGFQMWTYKLIVQ